jgi:hypothetical protein
MADYASDFAKRIDLDPHAGVVKVQLFLGIDPTLTREEHNALRAAAISGGYVGARDYLATVKPGCAPWIDHFTSDPVTPANTPTLRAKWVSVILLGGDIPAL